MTPLLAALLAAALRLGSGLLLGYFVLVVSNYVLATAVALPALVRLRRWRTSVHVDEAASAASTPPVTLVAPMFNEAAVCVEAVRALLGVDYASKEVLVVCDGCTDDTVARLTAAFRLVPVPRTPTAGLATRPVREVYRSRDRPELWLVDKDNGGKADALNVGINHCRTPLVCTLDGDSLLGRDAITRAVRPFLDDATTVAVGGSIGIVNDCTVRHGRVTRVRMPRAWLARFQVLEYVRAFSSARVGWDAGRALLVVSGAFGVFRREALVAVGGLREGLVGEDFELTLRLHRHYRERGLPYRVAFAPDAVSWTECPVTRGVLGRQRDRWHRGGFEAVWMHRRMLFNPRYGRIGLVALPVFLLVELLGPVAEALGYVAFVAAWLCGALNAPMAGLLLGLALALGVAQSVAAVALDEFAFRRYPATRDVALLLALALAENVGYRQLTVWWRLRGVWKFLRNDTSWGVMTRTGFTTVP